MKQPFASRTFWVCFLKKLCFFKYFSIPLLIGDKNKSSKDYQIAIHGVGGLNIIHGNLILNYKSR